MQQFCCTVLLCTVPRLAACTVAALRSPCVLRPTRHPSKPAVYCASHSQCDKNYDTNPPGSLYCCSSAQALCVETHTPSKQATAQAGSRSDTCSSSESAAGLLRNSNRAAWRTAASLQEYISCQLVSAAYGVPWLLSTPDNVHQEP
jgi:hypothetical protein